MKNPDGVLLPHGGYENLRSYKVAEAVYDATVVFCNRFISSDPDAPICPTCGKPMRRRTVGKGPQAGRTFWGCSDYPTCKGIRNEP